MNIEDMARILGAKVHEKVLAVGLCQLDALAIEKLRLRREAPLRAGHAQRHAAIIGVEFIS